MLERILTDSTRSESTRHAEYSSYPIRDRDRITEADVQGFTRSVMSDSVCS